MKGQMVVTQAEGRVEIVIIGHYNDEAFIIEQSENGLKLFGHFVSKTFDSTSGSICVTPLSNGVIELFIG